MQVIGDPPFEFGFEKLGIILYELKLVIPDAPLSINVHTHVSYDDKKSRVFEVVARYHGWELTRSWYYWVAVAKGKPLPRAVAEKLNEDWGEMVRVDGFAGGQSVKGDVYLYHIDSIDGLHAFARVLERLGI